MAVSFLCRYHERIAQSRKAYYMMQIDKRVIHMRCGAKCFIVEIEKSGEKKHVFVTARTPAGARKIIRKEYGNVISIISVKDRKKDEKGTAKK